MQLAACGALCNLTADPAGARAATAAGALDAVVRLFKPADPSVIRVTDPSH